MQLTPEIIAQLATQPQLLALLLQGANNPAPVAPAPAPAPVESDPWDVVEDLRKQKEKATKAAQATLDNATEDQLADVIAGISTGTQSDAAQLKGKKNGFMYTDAQKEEIKKAEASRLEYLDSKKGREEVKSGVNNAEKFEFFGIANPRKSDGKSVKTVRYI